MNSESTSLIWILLLSALSRHPIEIFPRLFVVGVFVERHRSLLARLRVWRVKTRSSSGFTMLIFPPNEFLNGVQTPRNVCLLLSEVLWNTGGCLQLPTHTHTHTHTHTNNTHIFHLVSQNICFWLDPLSVQLDYCLIYSEWTYAHSVTMPSDHICREWDSPCRTPFKIYII